MRQSHLKSNISNMDLRLSSSLSIDRSFRSEVHQIWSIASISFRWPELSRRKSFKLRSLTLEEEHSASSSSCHIIFSVIQTLLSVVSVLSEQPDLFRSFSPWSDLPPPVKSQTNALDPPNCSDLMSPRRFLTTTSIETFSTPWPHVSIDMLSLPLCHLRRRCASETLPTGLRFAGFSFTGFFPSTCPKSSHAYLSNNPGELGLTHSLDFMGLFPGIYCPIPSIRNCLWFL